MLSQLWWLEGRRAESLAREKAAFAGGCRGEPAPGLLPSYHTTATLTTLLNPAMGLCPCTKQFTAGGYDSVEFGHCGALQTHRSRASPPKLPPPQTLVQTGGPQVTHSLQDRVGLRFRASNPGWPAPLQEPTQTHFIRTRHCSPPGNYEGLLEIQELRPKTNIRTKDAPRALIT